MIEGVGVLMSACGLCPRFQGEAEAQKMYYECHGHIFMDGQNFKAARELHIHGVNREDVQSKLEIMKEHGITYFRDGGDHLGASEYARSISEEYGIEYRTPLYAIHRNGHYGGIVGRGFDDLKEYRVLVNEAGRGHADFIKVMFSGILDFSGSGGVNEQPLEPDEIREMIHIAHEEGFAVMAHVNGAGPVLAALEAGADSVEHGNFMDDDCIHALAEGNTVWVPTNVTIHNLLLSDRYDHRLIRKLDELQAETIRKAFALGSAIAPGSDSGAFMVPHGRGTVDEWERLLEILGNEKETGERLLEGAQQIRRRFRKG